MLQNKVTGLPPVLRCSWKHGSQGDLIPSVFLGTCSSMCSCHMKRPSPQPHTRLFPYRHPPVIPQNSTDTLYSHRVSILKILNTLLDSVFIRASRSKELVRILCDKFGWKTQSKPIFYKTVNTQHQAAFQPHSLCAYTFHMSRLSGPGTHEKGSGCH